jgi:hypothetical protein
MNQLVFLDARAGELEKILGGMKTMLVKESDPAHTTAQPVNPGDDLYFLRDADECTLRVKATVLRVLPVTNDLEEGLSQILKEMQSKLQLTEDQFNFWSARQQVLLVEFGFAEKIPMIRIASNKITDRSNWIAFEQFSRTKQEEAVYELDFVRSNPYCEKERSNG